MSGEYEATDQKFTEKHRAASFTVLDYGLFVMYVCVRSINTKIWPSIKKDILNITFKCLSYICEFFPSSKIEKERGKNATIPHTTLKQKN